MEKEEETQEESEEPEESSKKDESKDDSELEEKIEEESKEEEEIQQVIDNSQFQEFLQPTTGANVPILEKVADAAEQPRRLEQNFSQTPTPETNETRDYSSTPTQSDYLTRDTLERESDYSPPILEPITDSRNQGEVLLDPSTTTGINSQGIQPRDINVETSNQTRRLPFEREEKKYKEVKL